MEKPKEPKFYRWCFTLNNYTPEDIIRLRVVSEQVIYFICGREVAPTTGTPHLQGYVRFKNNKTLPQAKKWVGDDEVRASLRVAKGSDEDNFKYCSKEDPDFIEYGVPSPVTKAKQGQREDLTHIKELIDEGKTYEEIVEAEFDTCAKYHRFIKERITVRDNALIPKQELACLFPWEERLLKIIKEPPLDRKIYWIVDLVGGKGKSTFSKYLIDHHNAFYTNGGKGTDVIHAYQNQPVVIFDFAKQAEEYVQYNTIEMLKNGVAFSPKYESTLKRFKIPHVLVFANFRPDFEKIIKDRIIIISI